MHTPVYKIRHTEIMVSPPHPWYDYINSKNPSTMHVEGYNFKKVITYTCLINDIACRGLWGYTFLILLLPRTAETTPALEWAL